VSLRVVGEEEARGHYGTPRWPVHLVVTTERCTTCGARGPLVDSRGAGKWLEPCAGEGAIIAAANEVQLGIAWTAVEMNPRLVERHLQPMQQRGELVELHAGDFFPWALKAVGGGARFDVSLLNPAFPEAAAFVETCRAIARVTVALERLDWLSSESRAPFFRRVGEPDVWVLPNRPSFRGRGQDSGDYAWFVWGPGTTGRVHHLPSVSRELRAEDKHQTRLAL